MPGGIISCAWHRGPAAGLDFEIFTYYKQPDLGQQNGPAYTRRETGAADCSMRIGPLRRNDTGAYTVAVRHPAVTAATVNLTVYGESPPPRQRSGPSPEPPAVCPSVHLSSASTESPPPPPTPNEGWGP